MREIPTFKGASGRQIAFNASFEFPLLIGEISSLDLHGLIAEYEQRRILEYWEEILLPTSKCGPWLQAFKSKSGGGGHRDPVPQYLTAQALRHLSRSDVKSLDALLNSLRSGSLENQRDQVRSLMPATRKALAGILREPERGIGPDFHAMLLSFGSPDVFVQHLCARLRDATTPPLHSTRSMELLTFLWSQGKFLFSQDLNTWLPKNKWITMSNARYADQRATLPTATTAILIYPVEIAEFYALIYTFYATFDIRTAQDLSPDIISAYEHRRLAMTAKFAARKTPTSRFKREIRRTANTLLQYCSAQNPQLAISPPKPNKPKDASARRMDGLFRWLESARPELIHWAKAFREYIAQLRTSTTINQIGDLNKFGDYLCGLSNPPTEPWSVSRTEHIYDASLRCQTTYYEYLRAEALTNPSRIRALYQVRAFFDWYSDYLTSTHNEHAKGFKNPVRETDSFNRRQNYTGQTRRNALPPFVLNEMKNVLTVDDFAFPRAYKALAKVVDAQTGKTAKVWYPGFAVCLFLMLETPLRSHQARWLDSGLLDERVYDPKSNTEVRNPSAHAIPGRREGALRLQHDSLRNQGWLGLWVNTNKTAYYDSGNIGFLIPYVSEQLAELLTLMIEWQRRYMPPFLAPVSYYADGCNGVNRKPLGDKAPQVVPLFRDPFIYRMPQSDDYLVTKKQNTPINYGKLGRFYTAVLAETQKRIKDKHGHDIRLVTTDDNGEVRWAVDLHSLRVSGITSMIESGVPLEVVSQFVAGHATLVMTLHYLKYSPLKLREFLADAHQKMLDNTDFVGSELFRANLDEFAPFMLSQAGAGTGPGFASLKERTGIMTITSEGICPGTSCSTGGPAEFGHHVPVPGGTLRIVSVLDYGASPFTRAGGGS